MLIKKLPTAPPVTDAGLKAPSIINEKTEGIFCMFNAITPIANTIYKSAIKGTNFSVT